MSDQRFRLTIIALTLFGSGQVLADNFFNRIASFPVAANLPATMDVKTETSSEIISATDDGMMLVYSDSPLGGLGLVDIADPANPKAAGFIPLDGEPTSVIVSSSIAIVGVNTSNSYTDPSGKLVAIDLNTKTATQECDLGGQPDAVALSPDKSFVAIAIENERDEDLNDGVLPQLPAGYVSLIKLDGQSLDCDSHQKVELTGLSMEGSDDPEPEFVDINSQNEVVVTLQENNHLAVINGMTGELLADFSAGTVDLKNVDLDEERALTFDGEQLGRPREPDAVQWLDDERFVIANEGDYKGGSRGFTIFKKDGAELYESGLELEYLVARAGHYPERRSGNKGVEPEGLEVATFGGENYIFVLAERSGVVGVYRDTGAEPEFVQMLPAGIGPEGAIAIPSRNLFVVANEADLLEDGGARSYVMLYEQTAGNNAYPTIMSAMHDGKPIGWGALSGLAADPQKPGILYAVNDSFYALQPQILTIDANVKPAQITKATPITRGGMPAQLLDLEGITSDGEGGFWLASEGRTDRMIPHGLYHVNSEGEIKEQVAFPKELLAVEKRWASEGVTLIDNTLWVAIQRTWGDDPENTVKLVAYNLDDKSWGAVRYPVEKASKGWVGLSEITLQGDHVFIIERDNQIGDNAAIKRLYRVPLTELTATPLDQELPVVTKELVHDFLPNLRAANGYVVDKIEGFTFDVEGKAFAVTDNDGVDDSNGETLFFEVVLPEDKVSLR